MAVVPPGRPALVLMPRPGTAPGHEERPPNAKTCPRCRRTFARHPSIRSDDFSTRWLCPPCRHVPLGRTFGAHFRIVAAIATDRNTRAAAAGPAR